MQIGRLNDDALIQSAADTRYVNTSGDEMTGLLSIDADIATAHLLVQRAGTTRMELIGRDGSGVGWMSWNNNDVLIQNTGGSLIFNPATNAIWRQSGNEVFRVGLAAGNQSYEHLLASGARIRTQNRDVIVDDAARGLILKDAAGTPHYWRVTVSAAGALVITDLGTSIPAA
jgi:hypothetical protein